MHDRELDTDRVIEGHVEVRWSHGKFGGVPEAKIYLDTPHHDVAGISRSTTDPDRPANRSPVARQVDERAGITQHVLMHLLRRELMDAATVDLDGFEPDKFRKRLEPTRDREVLPDVGPYA